MNKPEPTATQARVELAEIEQARYRMSRIPKLAQAEAIARHYLAHAMTAGEILKMVEMCSRDRFSDQNPDALDLLDMMVSSIKQDHLHDFGIPLEWANFNPTTP